MHILTERYNNDKDLLLNILLTYFCFTTESQFDRCLDQLFGIVLSPEDDAKLMEKYGSPEAKRKGLVNYRHFCEVIGAGELSDNLVSLS